MTALFPAATAVGNSTLNIGIFVGFVVINGASELTLGGHQVDRGGVIDGIVSALSRHLLDVDAEAFADLGELGISSDLGDWQRK